MPEPTRKKRAKRATPRANQPVETHGEPVESPSPTEEVEVMEEPAESLVPTEVSHPVMEEPAEQTGQGEESELPNQEGVSHDLLTLQNGQARTNGSSKRKGITNLLHDDELIERVVAAMVDKGTMDKLADDIVAELHDLLQGDLKFKQRLWTAMVSDEKVRGRLIWALNKGFK